MKVKPMGMLLMMLAGWINRHQQDVIMYLKEENKILREKLGIEVLRIRASLVQGLRGHFARSLVDNSTPRRAMEGAPD